MIVHNILKTKGDSVVSVEADTTILDAARVLSGRRIGAVLILDDGRVAGVLSERDIVRVLATKGAAGLSASVREVMTTEVFTCTPEASIAEIMAAMTDRRIRHIPVLKEGVLCGVISIGDVVKHRIAETEQEAEALREYITTG